MIHINISINALKIVISISVIGNALGQPPKFEDGELQELLDKDSTQTQKELAAQLGHSFSLFRVRG